MRLQKQQSGFSHIVILSIVSIVVIAGVATWLVLGHHKDSPAPAKTQTQTSKQITSFDECASAGKAISQTYPETCSADGKNFVNPTQQAPSAP